MSDTTRTIYNSIRKPSAKGTIVFTDRRKEKNRKICRAKVQW